MKEQPHVTMAEIARKAGVSTATVSMSLRNKANIPAATRERIVELARSLGYQPNPYVSALMRSRRRGRPLRSRPVLAFVCALETPDGWKNSRSPTRRLIREGALERAAMHGYQAQEFWLHRENMTPERFSGMLHARGIQGLLIGPLADSAPPPELHWDYFAAVSLSVPFRNLTIPTVCNDHFFSTLRVVQECRRLGYRRPGLVFRRSHRELFQGRWEAGFFTAQQTVAGIEATRPLFVDDLDELENFPRAEFRRWLSKERPDAIITLGVEIVEKVLIEMKINVPSDIGLVALSCPELGHRYSGAYQHAQLIGATAVDVLVGLVERDERGLPQQGITTMVESQWNPGETLRQL